MSGDKFAIKQFLIIQNKISAFTNPGKGFLSEEQNALFLTADDDFQSRWQTNRQRIERKILSNLIRVHFVKAFGLTNAI